jgi:hypothetical protein
MPSQFDTFIESVMLVAESVNVTIVDAHNGPQDVHDLIWKLHNPFYAYLSKNLSPQETDHLRENKASEILSPDGSCFDQKEGVINFYTMGIPEKHIDTLLKLLKFYVGENDAEVTGPIKKDVSRVYNGQVYRIPVRLNEIDESLVAPELNLGGGNAGVLFNDILNYPNPAWEGGSAQIQELLMKIGQIEDNDYVINKNTKPETQEGNFYSGGTSREQIKRYLDVLRKMCEWGIKHNYSQISWG